MRYVESRYDQQQRDWAYRVYVTEALKAVVHTSVRYIDLFTPAETRSADEIISGIKMKLSEAAGGE